MAPMEEGRGIAGTGTCGQEKGGYKYNGLQVPIERSPTESMRLGAHLTSFQLVETRTAAAPVPAST